MSIDFYKNIEQKLKSLGFNIIDADLAKTLGCILLY